MPDQFALPAFEHCRALTARAVDAVVALEATELDVNGVRLATRDLVGQTGVDHALHMAMYDSALLATTSPTEASQRMAALSDIGIVLGGDGACDASLAFTLLEEAMDMISVSTAGVLFAHIEKRGTDLRLGMTATGGKGIVMLRMCNSLLRRIPHATMSEFAGRVHLFVANSFALSERSGVNLRGDISTDVVKTLGGDNSDQEEDTEDALLYQAFWSLQEHFASPASAFTPGSEFLACATRTLDEFRKTTSSRAPPLRLEPTGSEPLRYLTSPSLLRLQLNDAQFKCQILLQLLIFIKHSLAMSGDRLAELRSLPTANRLAVSGSALEVSESDQAALRELRKRASSQLVGAANDRGLFSRTAQFMLFHETAWVRWKTVDSCRPFELPSHELPELLAAMQAAARSFLSVRSAQFPAPGAPMGSTRLAELWPTPADATTGALDGLGSELQRIDLVAAMRSLDIYCRGDSDYDLLTESEQSRADVLQWRALRSSVMDNMFRRIDPASRSLAQLRDEFLASKEDEEEEDEVAEPRN